MEQRGVLPGVVKGTATRAANIILIGSASSKMSHNVAVESLRKQACRPESLESIASL